MSEPRTFRLAIGFFSEAGPLGSVLADLSRQGFQKDCLCVIGTADTLASNSWRAASVASLAGFRQLFDAVFELDGVVAAERCVASAGALLDDLRVNCRTVEWLSEAQRRRLGNHVTGGGVVLIVSSGTPNQQDASCRVLLRHSRHGVLMHDFTMRGHSSGSSEVLS